MEEVDDDEDDLNAEGAELVGEQIYGRKRRRKKKKWNTLTMMNKDYV